MFKLSIKQKLIGLGAVVVLSFTVFTGIYLYSLMIFKPELPYAATFSGHSFMLVLHVFFANLFLMFFPFTQLMHAILSIPMNKLRRG